MEKFGNNSAESENKRQKRVGYTAAFLAGALASVGVEQGINHTETLDTMEFAADKFELAEGQGLSEQNKQLVRAFLENPSQGLTLVFTEEEIAKMDDAREFGISDETEASIRNFETGESDNMTLHFTMEDVQKMNEIQDIFSHVDLSKASESVRNDFEIKHRVVINPKGTERVTVNPVNPDSEKVTVNPENPYSNPVIVNLENREEDKERAESIRIARDAAES